MRCNGGIGVGSFLKLRAELFPFSPSLLPKYKESQGGDRTSADRGIYFSLSFCSVFNADSFRADFSEPLSSCLGTK